MISTLALRGARAVRERTVGPFDRDRSARPEPGHGPALVTDNLDRHPHVRRLRQRGHGVRIRGGVSRTYYIGIESAMPAVPGMEAPLKALCVAPFGMEEGTEAVVPNRESEFR